MPPPSMTSAVSFASITLHDGTPELGSRHEFVFCGKGDRR